MQVKFEINFAGCEDYFEFPDDTPIEEIDTEYAIWLQNMGAGWEIVEDE